MLTSKPERSKQIVKLPYIPSVNPDTITVSGFSGGGNMASMIHVIYSDVISGAAIVSGGPFGYWLERQRGIMRGMNKDKLT